MYLYGSVCTANHTDAHRSSIVLRPLIVMSDHVIITMLLFFSKKRKQCIQAATEMRKGDVLQGEVKHATNKILYLWGFERRVLALNHMKVDKVRMFAATRVALTDSTRSRRF